MANAKMNATSRAAHDSMASFFPKGVLNKNDRTMINTASPINAGDNFSALMKDSFLARITITIILNIT